MHSDTAAYMEPEAAAKERHCRLYTHLLTSSPPLLKDFLTVEHGSNDTGLASAAKLSSHGSMMLAVC